LKAVVLGPNNASLLERFAVTRQRQKTILKLKEVDPKSLQIVIESNYQSQYDAYAHMAFCRAK
jgi:shikimate kinase